MDLGELPQAWGIVEKNWKPNRRCSARSEGGGKGGVLFCHCFAFVVLVLQKDTHLSL
jgi:hypothetical protein